MAGASAWRRAVRRSRKGDQMGDDSPQSYQIDHLALAVLDRFWCPISYVQLTPEMSIVRLDALDPRSTQLVSADAVAAAREIAGRRPSSDGRVPAVQHRFRL